MPIHQQLWSLECSVVETVASLFRGVTEHCLAWRRSHCPDKVDDIQAVRKFSTDQCNSFGRWCDKYKVQTVLHSTAKAILPRLTTCVFSKAENWGCFYEPLGTLQFFHTPLAFDSPVRGGSCRNIVIPFGTEKLQWLHYGEKSLRICLTTSTEYRRATDRRTKGRTDRHRITVQYVLCIRITQ